MDWKLYVLGLMLIISWVAQGVGLFTPHWMTKDGQSRGILPWHSGDSGWIKAATFELYIAFLVFIPAIGCYMIAVREDFKTGYTIRACKYLLILAFIVFISVLFTSGAVTSNTTDFSVRERKYEIGYSPGFCLGSAILSLIVWMISMYLGKGFRCCNQTPPIDA
ncbi:hypothetical protein L5515_009337 [Caenorhabditis briggsae]|uniref:Uncharacterized protein n=1 Tax=Caenorhabditis briggsae TaxID=6238 RepID=A0AAE9FBC7_CAEBR|nr:hypothetical protein L5515_009337 [Caenorhabditis briggsae]